MLRKLIFTTTLFAAPLWSNNNNMVELDKSMLESAQTMKVSSLEEAIATYDRLKKFEMVQAMAEILISRDPENVIAKKYTKGTERKALVVTETKPWTKEAAEASEAADADGSDAASAASDLAESRFYQALSKKDWAAARSIAKEWKQSQPGSDRADLWLAQVDLDSEKPADALAKLTAMKSAQKGDGFSGQVMMAQAHLALGHTAEAQALIDKVNAKPDVFDTQLVQDAAELQKEIKSLVAETKLDTAVEEKNAVAAREAFTEYHASQGDTDDAALMESKVLKLEGNIPGALAKLSQVKKNYTCKPFPAQLDLASAYLSNGNYAEASSALDEVVDSPGYANDEKKDAKNRLRDLRTDSSRAIVADGLSFNAPEGDAYYATGTYRGSWNNGRRWQVWTRLDDITLDKASSYVSQTSSSRVEGGIKVNQVWGDYVAGATLGAADDYAILGASLGSSHSTEGLRWNIDATANNIVSSSLQLQVVNARQHRIALSLEKQLAPRWYFDLTAQGRYVHLDNTRFGTGIGAEYSLLYNAVCDSEGEAVIRLGYLGNVQRFRGKSSPELAKVVASGFDKSELANMPENLMEPNINQHGVLVELNGNIGEEAGWSLGGAALYDTFDERFEYVGRANVNCWMTDNCRFSLGLEYLSAGQGANNEGAIVTGTAGILVSF